MVDAVLTVNDLRDIAAHGDDSLVGMLWSHAALLVEAPPHAQCSAIVIVPARDEEDGITRTLDALAAQCDLAGKRLDPTTWEVLVLANNCRDATATVARAWAARAQVAAPDAAINVHVVERQLPDEHAHIGVARRLLMDAAASRLEACGRRRGIIISTDADTLAEPTWLAATRAEIDAGADVVGGRILVQPADAPPDAGSRAGRAAQRAEHRARRAHLRDVMYRALASELQARLDPQPFDPWPRHFQHFGASVAVTLEAYRAVGGLPPCQWHEDVALIERLRAIDARIRHSPQVVVRTSARTSTRTGFGFAAQLDQWHDMQATQQPQLVRHPEGLVVRTLAMRQLRQLWQSVRELPLLEMPNLHALATDLAVDSEWLDHAVRTTPTFGLLWQRVEAEQERTGAWLARWPKVEITQGISALRAILAPLRESLA